MPMWISSNQLTVSNQQHPFISFNKFRILDAFNIWYGYANIVWQMDCIAMCNLDYQAIVECSGHAATFRVQNHVLTSNKIVVACSPPIRQNIPPHKTKNISATHINWNIIGVIFNFSLPIFCTACAAEQFEKKNMYKKIFHSQFHSGWLCLREHVYSFR